MTGVKGMNGLYAANLLRAGQRRWFIVDAIQSVICIAGSL